MTERNIDAGPGSPSRPDQTEVRMRSALGLAPARTDAGHGAEHRLPSAGRPRHRFVQDGEVPVTVLRHAAAAEPAPLQAQVEEL